MKKCPKCGESKDLNCFGPDRRGPEGKNWICRDCKNFAQREFNQTPKGKYLSYKKGSKQRGYSFTLTMDEFMGFWNKSCFYCAIDIPGVPYLLELEQNLEIVKKASAGLQTCRKDKDTMADDITKPKYTEPDIKPPRMDCRDPNGERYKKNEKDRDAEVDSDPDLK